MFCLPIDDRYAQECGIQTESHDKKDCDDIYRLFMLNACRCSSAETDGVLHFLRDSISRHKEYYCLHIAEIRNTVLRRGLHT